MCTATVTCSALVCRCPITNELFEMMRNNTNLEIDRHLTQNVLDLAVEAGERIMRIYGQSELSQVTLKSDASPLTEADLQSHAVIVAGLRAINADIPIVSEEGAQLERQHLSCTDHWLVDPLDGTKEFLAKSGEFTVNIALIRNGKPIFGVVSAPALGVLYWGTMETGAVCMRDGVSKQISVSRQAHDKTQRLRIAASKSHMNDLTREFIEKLGDCELHSVGSSLKFCKIAEGEIDCYPRFGPTCEWDTAAGQAVLEAAGGIVLDPSGESIGYGKQEILNSHFIASAVPYEVLQSRFKSLAS